MQLLKVAIGLVVFIVLATILRSLKSETGSISESRVGEAKSAVEPESAPAEGPDDQFRCGPGMGIYDPCYQWIPGGSFLMGAQAASPENRGYDAKANLDEGPPRDVQVSGFWVQLVEVRASDYQRCIDGGECSEFSVDDAGFFRLANGEINGPVNGVTWSEAQTFCKFMGGGRLPTEAEWEYLARAAENYRFPWGDQVLCPDKYQLSPTRLVKRDYVSRDHIPGVNEPTEAEWDAFDCSHFKPPGEAGEVSKHFKVYGLAGGVWEWVSDWYAEDYYASAPAINPKGPLQGEKRVQRGGGWMSDLVWDFRSAGRASLDPNLRFPDVGFRCAWSNEN